MKWAMCARFLITHMPEVWSMTCLLLDQECIIPKLHPLEVCYLQKQAADRGQPSIHTKPKPPTNLLLPAWNKPWQNYLALHLLLQMSLGFHRAAHIGSVMTTSAFVSPALGIHPCCSQWNTHICVLFISTLFFIFLPVWHSQLPDFSVFLASQLFSGLLPILLFLLTVWHHILKEGCCKVAFHLSHLFV